MKLSIRRFIKIPFVRDVATMQAGTFFITGGNFVASIILARLLGPRAVGLYALTFTIMGTVGILLDLGQNYSLITLLPAAYTQKNKESVRDSMSYFLSISLLWVLPVALLMIIATPWLINQFYPEHEIALLVQTAFITLLFLPFHDFFRLILQSTRRIKKLVAIDIIFDSLDMVLPLLMLIWQQTVFALVLGRVMAAFIKSAISFLLWKRYFNEDDLIASLSTMLRYINLKSIAKGLNLGLWISADKHIYRIMNSIPTYLLGIYGSVTEIGKYKYLMSYLGIANLFSGNVNKLLNTVLPSIHAKNIDKFHSSFWKGSIGNGIISSAILIPLIILGNNGISFLYGNEFVVPYIVFPMLLVLALDSLTVGFGTYYRIHNALHLAIISQIVSAAVGLLVWIMTNQSLPMFIAVILYYVSYSLTSKVIHIINFWTINRTPECHHNR
ncbi:oligosaccharide flippase family protein [Patescibacteria group bacterium]|nr:oligosaccharide flippase family protein [Patescibacteria group bacterium]